MAILSTGNTYVDNDQVTAATLNAAINSATFAAGAVDGATTQLSGGKIIVRDAGISPVKLSPGGPNWTNDGTLTAVVFDGLLNGNVIGNVLGNVIGNVSGTAGNVTGTVAIANGGTGATDAAGAATNLGATTAGANLLTIPNPSAIRFLRVNANNTVSSLTDVDFRVAIGASGGGGSGTVTSVAVSGGSTGLTVTGSPITTSGTITLQGTLALASGGTGATNAGGARSALGLGTAAVQNSTTVGANLLTLADATPEDFAVRFLRINSDDTVSRLTVPDFVTAIGAYSATNPSAFIPGNIGTLNNSLLRTQNVAPSFNPEVSATIVTIDDVGNCDGIQNFTFSGVANASNPANGYRVQNVQVLGAQAAAEANVSATGSLVGGDTVDEGVLLASINALETKINNLLAKLRTHGIIAT